MTVVPEVFVRFEDSEWPPAQHDTPVGTGLVGGFTLERQLVSAALPGNLRGRSGLSVGTCQNVTIRQSFPAEMTPWGRGSRRVKPGGKAHLYTSPSGRPGDVGESLGAWLVDPLSGSVGDASMSVDLIEASSAGKVENRLPVIDFTDRADPAWIVDTLARQAGFYSTPAPVDSCVLSVPMAGSLHAEQGASNYPYPPDAWAPSGVGIVPEGYWSSSYTTGADFDSGGELFFTFSMESMRPDHGLYVSFPGSGFEDSPALNIYADGRIQVSNASGDSWTSGTFSRSGGSRIQVHIQRFGSAVSGWTSLRARARSGGGDWGSWVENIDPGSRPVREPWGRSISTITLGEGFPINGMQLSTRDEPGLWASPTADIEPVGGRLTAPYVPAETTAWDGIQQVCDAWQAVAWVSLGGIFKLRGRAHLSGSTVPLLVANRLDADREVEQLSWRVDPGDRADRLEITYYPAAILSADSYAPGAVYPEVARVEEVIEIAPYATVEIALEVKRPSSKILSWAPGWHPAYGSHSNWSAWTAADGTGMRASDNALTVSHHYVNTGRLIVALTNGTSQRLFTVDLEGKPAIVVRGLHAADMEVAATLSRGLPAHKAKNSLTIDLGKFVQTAADAEAIADYIWARVQEPGTQIEKIRVPFDPVIDIGDIRRLVHAPTGLDAKVLIVGVTIDAGPGQMDMLLDVVVLPPTVADFNHVWRGRTVQEFNDFWAGKNVAAFNDNPLAIGA